MAKKTPKTETSTIEKTAAEQQDKKQVAAVNVDSKMSLPNLIKSPRKRMPTKSPTSSKEWQRASRA